MCEFKFKLPFVALLISFCTFVVISSCNGCKKKTRTFEKTDIVPITIDRFERDLFSIDTNRVGEGLQKLSQKYKDIYFSYAQDILAMPFEGDSLFTSPMKMLLAYKPFRDMQHKVDSFYPNLDEIETEFGKAMSIYKKQFPNANIPKFVTFISEFGYANVTFEKRLGIGLDMYMNKVYSDYYKALEFPNFMIQKLQREYIVPNTIKSLGISRYESQSNRDKRFLAMMIFEGKVRYFTKALLPETHDSLIMGYTTKQLKWCEENESEIWAHFIEKNLLYKDNPMDYMRYFNDGPFTSADGVPPESAPAIGVWTGWQIVNEYMNNYPDVTLQQLMDEYDFDKILKGSRYRPE